MIEDHRATWIRLGALAAVILAVIALCCLDSTSDPMPPRSDVPPPPVIVAVPDAAADDAGTVDAGAPCDAPPVVFDSGPSCGSHAWCPHPKPCCTDVLDCC